MRRFLKNGVIYPLEALGVVLILMVCKILGLRGASWAMGSLLRMVGPCLSVHRVALGNLALAFPETSEAERQQIARDMWENLGRTLGEYPHLKTLRQRLVDGRIPVENSHILDQAFGGGGPGLLITGHFANWEVSMLTASVFAERYQQKLAAVYRRPNNLLVDKLLRWLRHGGGADDQIAKGPRGAREFLRYLKDKNHVGLLVDQKMNDGVPVPFFGVEAMTAPAVAQFAMRFGIPLVAAQVVRTGGANFKVIVEPPIDVTAMGSDPIAVLTEVHRYLENWIRANPAQWMWVHKRWPKEALISSESRRQGAADQK